MADNRTATEILEQDYKGDKMAQTLIEQYRTEEHMTDEEILRFLIAFY